MSRARGKKGGLLSKAVLLVFAFTLGVFVAFLWETYRVAAPPGGVAAPYGGPGEVEPEEPGPGEKGRAQPAPVRVAIVIDDMGYDLEILRRLFDLDVPITISVLPYMERSAEVAEEANSRGWEVMLHLPMEPEDLARNDPGKGALFITMADDEVRSRLLDNMEAVPFVVGVNNHMGSRFTSDDHAMRVVLDVIKKSGVYFLDSKTSTRSVAASVARDLGIRTTSRSVFLDNRRDKEYIREQLEKLLRIAAKNGKAVAIGHPYPETIEVLLEMLPEMAGRGVEVARVSDLVD